MTGATREFSKGVPSAAPAKPLPPFTDEHADLRDSIRHWGGVGMPSGLSFPSALGIITRFTGGGKYDPDDMRFQSL